MIIKRARTTIHYWITWFFSLWTVTKKGPTFHIQPLFQSRCVSLYRNLPEIRGLIKINILRIKTALVGQMLFQASVRLTSALNKNIRGKIENIEYYKWICDEKLTSCTNPINYGVHAHLWRKVAKDEVIIKLNHGMCWVSSVSYSALWTFFLPGSGFPRSLDKEQALPLTLHCCALQGWTLGFGIRDIPTSPIAPWV